MTHEIFISYSSHDAEQAFEICNHLENHNFKCWIAPRDIVPSASYASEIVKGLKESTLVVLILSEYSLHSEHVLNEVELAIKFGKIVLPYIITGLNINDKTYLQLTSPNSLIERIVANKHLFVKKKWLSIVTDFDGIAYLNRSVCYKLSDNMVTTFAISPNDKTIVIQSKDKKYECLYHLKDDTDNQILNIRFQDLKKDAITSQEIVKQEIIHKYDVEEDFKFNEGIACIFFNDPHGLAGHLKLLNLQQEVITELKYFYDYSSWAYSDGTIRLGVQTTDDFYHILYGYLSIDGKPLIPFKYRNCKPFSEGLAAVCTDEKKWGYIDKTGAYAIPPIFDVCFSFREGRAVVKIDGKYRIVDKQGQYISDMEFDKTGKLYRNGFLWVCLNDLYGFINYSGDIVIPIEYSSAKSFNLGLAPVKKNEKWGYVNASNEVLIDFQYDDAFAFSDISETAVIIQNHKQGVIDVKGSYILKPEYDEISSNNDIPHLMSNYLLLKDGLYGLYSYVNSVLIYPKYKEFENSVVFNNLTAVAATEDDQWVIITKDLTEIKANSKIDYIRPFYDGNITEYSIDDYWGLIDNKGHLLTDAIYDSITLFSEAPLHFVTKNGKTGAVTNDGFEFLPCIFEQLSFHSDLIIAKLTELDDYVLNIDMNGFLLSPYSLRIKYSTIIKRAKCLYQQYLNGKYTYDEYFKLANPTTIIK